MNSNLLFKICVCFSFFLGFLPEILYAWNPFVLEIWAQSIFWKEIVFALEMISANLLSFLNVRLVSVHNRSSKTFIR